MKQQLPQNRRISEFNSIYKKCDELYRDIAKTFGLSDCAFWILYSLRESEGCLTQSDICNSLYQPKQTVNSALKKLEHEGYILLHPIKNRRSKQIALTDKGVRLAAQTADCVLLAEETALSQFSSEELYLFYKLFRKYVDLLEQNLAEIKSSAASNKRFDFP